MPTLNELLEELEQYSENPGNDIIANISTVKVYAKRLVHKTTKEVKYWLRCAIENRVDGILIHRLFSEEEYKQIRARLANNEKPSEVLKPYGEIIEYWKMLG